MACSPSAAPASAASRIIFRDLCQKFEKINKFQDKKKKVEYLEKYISWFREMSVKLTSMYPLIDDSFYPLLRLMLPQLDRERGAYGVKENLLAKVYIRILCLPKEGPDASQLLNFKAPGTTRGTQAGDFADVAFWVLRNRCPAEGGLLTVDQVNTHLDNIALKHAAHEPRGVDEELMTMLRAMSAEEQKWLIRILLKDIKLGLGQIRIFSAYHPDAQELYDVSNNLVKVCQQLKNPSVRLNEIDVSIFSPFRAMLSERCDISTVEALLKKGQYYYVETKHDGERFQIHISNGEYKYFSKNGYEYTETYGGTAFTGLLTPQVAKLLKGDIQSCILDGEMMAWNVELQCYRAKGINFDVKSLKPGDKHRPCFCVFDILLLNNQVLSNKPLEERYAYLENLFTPAEGIIELTKKRKVTKKEEIIEELNSAIDSRLEGIMLKDPTSVYRPNQRKAGWFKIKPEYTEGLMDHIDVLIIGGYYGEGRRKGIISHFLVGIAVPPLDKSSKPTEFHSVGRVGSGYTLAELGELLQKMAPYWQRVTPGVCPKGIEWTKEKPDVWISKEHSYILEIKATEINYSNMFRSGYTFRFPRVEKIRYDKNWFDCTTTVQFEQLRVEADGKLSSRQYTSGLAQHGGSPPKKQRTSNRAAATLGEQFRRADVSDVTALSNRLDGKEFCVLTGWQDLTKQEIETKIVKHGGTVVQNVRPSSFCALASEENSLRVRNIVKCGQYNVARMEWILPLLTDESTTSVPPWTPRDLICPSPATLDRLAEFYDQYGDNYSEPATRETLLYSLNQVQKKKGSRVALDQKDMADLDVELFSGPSPYGVFRLCYAYFDKEGQAENKRMALDIAAQDFSFYGGIINETISEETTHVIAHSLFQESLKEFKSLNRQRTRKFHIMSEKWIEASLKEGSRQQECLYYCT